MHEVSKRREKEPQGDDAVMVSTQGRGRTAYTQKDTKTCYYCGKPDHIARFCFKTNNNKEKENANKAKHNVLKNNRIRGEITQSKAHRSHKYVNNAWSCWKTIGSEERLRNQKHIDHTSMWTMLGVRYPTPLQPCSLFPSLYHHIDKPYGITISLPPYFNMFVVLTYFKSTYVFDCLQSSTLFLISTTPLSMFHLHHNLQ